MRLTICCVCAQTGSLWSSLATSPLSCLVGLFACFFSSSFLLLFLALFLFRSFLTILSFSVLPYKLVCVSFCLCLSPPPSGPAAISEFRVPILFLSNPGLVGFGSLFQFFRVCILCSSMWPPQNIRVRYPSGNMLLHLLFCGVDFVLFCIFLSWINFVLFGFFFVSSQHGMSMCRVW